MRPCRFCGVGQVADLRRRCDLCSKHPSGTIGTMRSIVLEVVVAVADDNFDSNGLREDIKEVLSMMDAFEDLSVTVIKEGAIDSAH